MQTGWFLHRTLVQQQLALLFRGMNSEMRSLTSPVLVRLCVLIAFGSIAFAQSSSSSGGSQGGGTSGQSSHCFPEFRHYADDARASRGRPDLPGQRSAGHGYVNSDPLSLGDAIDRGLKANLGLLTSQQSSVEVRAQRYRALSGLLPTVTGQVGETVQQLNLQAVGSCLVSRASPFRISLALTLISPPRKCDCPDLQL